MSSPKIEVRFPAMREEVKFAIAAFSNEPYQLAAWRADSVPVPGHYYDFTAACHALLNDTELIDDPQSMVGTVLANQAELDVATRLANFLLDVIDRIGPAGTFEDVLRSGLWPGVLATARVAMSVVGPPAKFPWSRRPANTSLGQECDAAMTDSRALAARLTGQLRYLARTYFHQDYQEESGSSDGAIKAFARDEAPAAVNELTADIRTLLDSPANEQNIEDLRIKDWRANYNPGRYGVTYREWLTHVLQVLQTPASR